MGRGMKVNGRYVGKWDRALKVANRHEPGTADRIVYRDRDEIHRLHGHVARAWLKGWRAAVDSMRQSPKRAGRRA